MAGAKIKGETLYVIYHNGEPYEHVKKPVYLSPGPARGQITQVAEEIARNEFENIDKGHNYWWDLPRSERELLIQKAKTKFEVVEYGPKG